MINSDKNSSSDEDIPDSPLGKRSLQDSLVKHSYPSNNQPKLSSKQPWRKKCFNMKREMILDKNFEFVCTFVVGFLFIIPWLISLVIIYNRFDQPYVLKKHYSDAITPLIFESGFICLLISFNIYSLVKEMLAKGLLVWYRNSFGSFL